MSNYQVFNAGEWESLNDHVFRLGELRAKGKVFLSEKLGSDGTELSLNRLDPGVSYNFLHKHREHEEIYLVVSGRGDMLIDGNQIALREGTSIRIAPDGVRTIRSAHDSPLCFVCIQAVIGTLNSRTITDGVPVEGNIEWDDTLSSSSDSVASSDSVS